MFGIIFPLLNASDSLNDKSKFYLYYYYLYLLFKNSFKASGRPTFEEFSKLFSCWSNVFSRNKCDLGFTIEEYYIRLADETPVKSYVSRQSPAVVEAIRLELEKLEKADFIESSTGLY